MAHVIEQTGSLHLLTNGERRYGNLLFEICHELIRTGRPGRPKKLLPKGVRVRLKNKGSQKGPGRKRQKYQAPVPEHPETEQEVTKPTIHANHVGAFKGVIKSDGLKRSRRDPLRGARAESDANNCPNFH